MKRTLVAAIGAAAALAATVLAPVASAAPGVAVGSVGSPATGGAQCAPNFVYVVPGGANTEVGVPEALPFGAYTAGIGVGVRNAAPGRVIDRYVAYQSVPGGFSPYTETRDAGLEVLTTMVARDAAACPGARISVVGYSEGADIAAHFLNSVGHGNGPVDEDRVTSAFLLANPNRGVPGVPQGGSAGATTGAFGAMPGGYGTLNDRVLEFCNAGDVVCDSTMPLTMTAQDLASAALLRGNIPVGKIIDTIRALRPAELTQFLAELGPALTTGVIRHTDYYSSNATAAAVDHVVLHLA
ncbi:cutinase family protein [Corynebacterium bovis]|uniref:cutinase family protein n=1 Tax=Corynebacterium bovis TaxID=36808 RepID=UPI000F6475AE|nr:cutinase family protein [Corynebacterium bovis]RRO81618.1 hypothetical protein CXF36_06780 [Corynebacterium bovis]RRO82467.1 hypothetical protein CXF37_06760 [Corynebacterium bovis]